MPFPRSRRCLLLAAFLAGAQGLACAPPEPPRDDRSAAPTREPAAAQRDGSVGPTRESPAPQREPETCDGDTHCTLYCGGTSCCTSDCPCDVALHVGEAARRREALYDKCAEIKMECRPMKCEHTTQFRARCVNGACIAEPIDAPAAPASPTPKPR